VYGRRLCCGVAYYELSDHFEVQADLPTTWRFFSAVENLAKITPPWLAFTVRLNGPVEIGDGSLLDYTIRWLGVPIRWRTRIIDWSPPRQFIDIQLRGRMRCGTTSTCSSRASGAWCVGIV